MKNTILIFFIVFFVSCGAKKPKILSATNISMVTSLDYEPFIDITEFSTDKEYGLVEGKPVKVGDRSALNQRRFIASLAGPSGQVLSFYRVGSCCPYPSENGLSGNAIVDKYSITYKGLKKPILMYISFYDYEPLKIPFGFTKREL